MVESRRLTVRNGKQYKLLMRDYRKKVTAMLPNSEIIANV